MRKFAVGVLIVILALMLTGAVSRRNALACELIPAMNYQEIHNVVFLDSGISEEQIETIKELIDLASERISLVYGPPESKPRLLVTSNGQTAERWGANETASMHRMPWGSCIVIGPKGQNVDVIAHEWLHAEMQHRIGFFRFLKIPVWFDEGVALTVDYREPFLPENIELADTEILAVKKLKSGRSFFSNDIRRNYQAARLAVVPLIHSDQLYHDLERITLGESFENVFLKANKQMKPTVNTLAD